MNALTVYNDSTLQNFYDANIDYITNKKMYIELNKIKNLILNANYLGNTVYTYTYTYTYTSPSDNDYFALLLQKIGIMFPDSIITYTLYSNPTNFIIYIPNSIITYIPSINTISNSIKIDWA